MPIVQKLLRDGDGDPFTGLFWDDGSGALAPLQFFNADQAPLTDAQLTAQALGTEATLEAVRTLLAGTLAVSGPLTNAQLTAQALATDAKLEAVRALLAATLTVTQAGFDSTGQPLPPGFDTYAKNAAQTWDSTTGLPLVRTEVVTVGANTYTRTITNTITGSNITNTAYTRWVKA